MRLLLSAVLLVASPAKAEAPPPTGRCQDSITWLAPDALPDGTPALARDLATWLTGADLDRELLDPAAIAALNQRNLQVLGAWRDPLTDLAPAQADVDRELAERVAHLGVKLASGEYVLGPAPGRDDLPDPRAFERAARQVENALPIDSIQAIVEPQDLRCIPLLGGLYRGAIDRQFDRNQCSRLHPGELVRVLRRTRDGWLYVRAGHGVGWLEDALLGPPMTPSEARGLRGRPRLTVLGDLVPAETALGELVFLRLGTGLPLVDAGGDTYQILLPSPSGWTDGFVAKSPAVRPGFLPLTRKNALTLAFARLDDPYGWGGLGGFRDCSGLLLDLAASFDLRLGRNSSVQALAGASVVDLGKASEADKLAAVHAAHERGLVLLYMPGHIMLYLGQRDGRDYALSAISEYLLPCPDGGYRTVRLDRVAVTDLERGRGTERTAFLQRLATLAIFGR